jgi:uncharacterized protein (TIGR00661 family)
MRARALAQHLEARGHVVKLAASGRAVGILARHGLDVLPIDGMSMRFAEGEARLGRTLLQLLRSAPRAIARNAEVAWDHVIDFDPDVLVLVTDFDTFTSAVGGLLGRPVISVDHQHVVDRFRHPRAVKDAMSSYRVARAVVTAKTPRCAHYVVTSFFFPEPRWGSTTLVGPVVRREVADAVATRGEHVLVYQTTSGDSRLVPALAAVRGTKFVLYGLTRRTCSMPSRRSRASRCSALPSSHASRGLRSRLRWSTSPSPRRAIASSRPTPRLRKRTSSGTRAPSSGCFASSSRDAWPPRWSASPERVRASDRAGPC